MNMSLEEKIIPKLFEQICSYPIPEGLQHVIRDLQNFGIIARFSHARGQNSHMVILR